MTITVNREKFIKTKNPFPKVTEKERKINLKIEKDDLLLIDKLCDKYGVSRTTLLNQLLEAIFYTQIGQIDDPRIQTLLLMRADKKIYWQKSSIPWSWGYHIKEIQQMISNLICSGQPDGGMTQFRPEENERNEAVQNFFKKLDEGKQND